MNQSIHYIDLLIWMMGEVKTVCGFAEALAHDIEVEDCATAALRFSDRSQGMIQGTTCTYRGYEARLGLHGTRGNITIVGDELMMWDLEGEEVYHNPAAGHAGGASDPKSGMVGEAVTAHARQIRDVILAVEEGREPELSADEARRSVEVILAIYKSARQAVSWTCRCRLARRDSRTGRAAAIVGCGSICSGILRPPPPAAAVHLCSVGHAAWGRFLYP